jgi:hypothetical protein
MTPLIDLTGIEVGTTGQIDLDKTPFNCMANYLTDGSLNIPCVSISNETGEITSIIKGKLIQRLPDLIFDVDSASLEELN